ncbi:ricin-type beta-trefoil lectin domain protein [Streptacidiphilus monticola]
MWGGHILYVQALDQAGNAQTLPSSYSFYAPWDPNTKVTAGDLTNDGIPDMLATDTTGDLILLAGSSDPTTQRAVIASTPSSSPDHTSWNKYLVAHRGSLQNGGVDDLFAYNPGLDTMYRYTNDGENGGTYGHFTLTSGASAIARPACTSGRCANYNSDWSGVKAMTAPGDITGDTTFTRANLITKELDGSGSQELWLYQNTTKDPLTNPILLGTGDWSHFDLISPASSAVTSPPIPPAHPPFGLGTTSPASSTPSPQGRQRQRLPADRSDRRTLTLGVTTTSGARLCAADPAASTTSGVAAITWTCNSGPEQAMIFLTDHTVRLYNGLCLDAGATTNGAAVDFATCTGATDQQWTQGPSGSLKNTAAALCLADPSGSQTPAQNSSCGHATTAPNRTGEHSPAAASTPVATAPTRLQPVLTTAAYPTVASPATTPSSDSPTCTPPPRAETSSPSPAPPPTAQPPPSAPPTPKATTAPPPTAGS